MLAATEKDRKGGTIIKRTEAGTRIATERERLGLSQGQLADFAGMSREQINRLERGRRQLTSNEAVSIALILGLTADELGVGHDTMQFRGSDATSAARQAISVFERFVRNWQTIDTLRSMDEG